MPRRDGLTARAPAFPAVAGRRRPGEAAAGVARFALHVAEMWVAMLLGMAVFGPVRLALAAHGYAALLDPMSIASEVGMAVFMTAPMVAWMRVRGCGWRHGLEMAVGMLGPWAAVLILVDLGAASALPWLATAGRPAMLLGMLAVMLYHRQHYTGGYAFLRWPAAVGPRPAPATPLSRARPPAETAGGG
jgi:hypothetical protein